MNPPQVLKPLSNNSEKLFERIKNKIYTTYSQNPAKMMVHTGTIGWTLSSAAQLWNVATSDKFTPDEKKFLIPQEALDAMVNIALFYGITNTFKNLSGKLVSSGKLLSKPIREYIAKNPVKDCKLGDFNTKLTDTKLYGNDEKFFDIYQPFKSGVDMSVNLVASVVASNIITPYVRNYIGAKRQKHSIEQERIKTQSTYPIAPVLPAQNDVGVNKNKMVYPKVILGGNSGSAMKI